MKFCEWLGPFESGLEISDTHTWSEGSYNITVKAKDIHDAESDWSDPFPISMPRNRLIHNSLVLKLLERFPNVFPILRYIFKSSY